MSDDHAIDIDKKVRGYLFVGLALLVLTVVTVLISYVHVAVPLAITIGLFIACIKGSLVACFFMHLISEKKLIYWVLIVTVIFFFALLFLPVLTSIADQMVS